MPRARALALREYVQKKFRGKLVVTESRTCGWFDPNNHIRHIKFHFYQELVLLKETAHDIKELHEAVYNIILIFVPLHVAGVVVADIRDEKGIISNMINGN